MAISTTNTLHALVIGATGVSGWALCLQLLKADTPIVFETVTLTTLRPISLSQAQWPEDSRLRVCSGIDLNRPREEVVDAFRSIPGITNVTHVFYVACYMLPTYDMAEQSRVNVKMTKVTLEAIETAATRTKHVAFQAGSLVYGIPFADYLGENFRPSPFHESFARIPPPFSEMICNYAQEDDVKAMAKKNSWTWSSIRPDTVVGFTPRNSPHCLCVSLGVYLSFYRYLYGVGAVINFPGSKSAWLADFTVVGQNQLAKFNVFAAINAASLDTESAVMNISNGDTTSWEQIWQRVASDFGLTGLPPVSASAEADVADLDMPRFGADWFETVKDKAAGFEAEYGLQTGYVTNIAWQYLAFVLNIKIDRVLDIQRARDFGFKESSSTVADFQECWNLMRKAKMIPFVDVSIYAYLGVVRFITDYVT